MGAVPPLIALAGMDPLAYCAFNIPLIKTFPLKLASSPIVKLLLTETSPVNCGEFLFALKLNEISVASKPAFKLNEVSTLTKSAFKLNEVSTLTKSAFKFSDASMLPTTARIGMELSGYCA